MLPAMHTPLALLLASVSVAQPAAKTEHFDADPGWQGVNARAAREQPPVTIRQDFGYSRTKHAGGGAGEIGGFITPAGEAAYYATAIPAKTLADRLSASGTLSCPDGPSHLLLGFFNSRTVNEWRTPSTIALRINGRGDHFFAYVEYCTAKWRAGGDSTPFPSTKDPATGRLSLIGFPSGGKVHRWSLSYDPAGAGGNAVVTATIGDAKAVCEIDADHRTDGATFDRFGLLNIVKSADGGGEIYIDDVSLDGTGDSFDEDPRWEGRGNRRTYASTIIRPRWDVGFSPTRFAGGMKRGELGGVVFRGDCRYADKMSALGDAVGPLTLERPLRVSGRVALTRGVSDSTTFFGFYNSTDSLRRNDTQNESIAECVLGIYIEGPSSEGFCFYPVYRAKGGGGGYAPPREGPRILPNGAGHDFLFEYDPAGAGDRGRITVALDGKTVGLDLGEGDKLRGSRFDRFGLVTTWIDGNSQSVYWDDLTYSVKQ